MLEFREQYRILAVRTSKGAARTTQIAAANVKTAAEAKPRIRASSKTTTNAE